jgi:hypothetical protein
MRVDAPARDRRGQDVVPQYTPRSAQRLPSRVMISKYNSIASRSAMRWFELYFYMYSTTQMSSSVSMSTQIVPPDNLSLFPCLLYFFASHYPKFGPFVIRQRCSKREVQYLILVLLPNESCMVVRNIIEDVTREETPINLPELLRIQSKEAEHFRRRKVHIHRSVAWWRTE